MKTFIYILMAAAAIGFFTEAHKKQKIKKVNQFISQSVASGKEGLAKVGIPHTCEGKKTCFTVYVAPWCGVCKASEPTFQALNTYLLKNRPDMGFGLVIGAAQATENLKMQKDVLPLVSLTDDSGELMKLREIRSYPTWVTTDLTGKEINRISGGLQITNEAQLPLVVDKLMGKN